MIQLPQYSLFLALISLLLTACKSDDPGTNTGGTFTKPQSPHSISLLSELVDRELDIETSEVLKSLSFDLKPNPNSQHAHPKISLSHREGKELNAVLLFRNAETQVRFIATNVTFTFNTKKKAFEIKDLNLDQAPADIEKEANKPQSWHILCLVGGTYRNDGKLLFSASQDIKPLQAKATVSNDPNELPTEVDLEAIYMSKAWLPLDYTWDAKKKKGRFSLRPTIDQTDPKKKYPSKIQLQNQCLTLMCRISPNKLGRDAKVQGFRISTSSLSFDGHFELNNLQGDQMPSYSANAHSRLKYFWTSDVETVAKDQHSKYYICNAVPIAETCNLRISPLIGDTRAQAVETKFSDYTNKPIARGHFVGINNLASGPKILEHPIEGFFTSGYESREITRNGSGRAEDLNHNRGYTTDAGHYRVYGTPTIYQLAVLLPGMKGGYSRSGAALSGNNSRAILDFQLGRYHDTKKTDINGSDNSIIEKEKIFVWGNGDNYTEFDAIYEHHGASGHDVRHYGNTYYGIRFQGDGDKYLSAYRFTRVGNDIEITVRTLGPKRSGTSIGTVKQHSFWTKPLEWDQREWKRIIKQGRYWSTNSTKRNRLGGTNVIGAFAKTVYDTMKVFLSTGEDGVVAQSNGAFVTSGKHRPSHLEDPDKATNNNNYFLLYTTDQNGRPFRP